MMNDDSNGASTTHALVLDDLVQRASGAVTNIASFLVEKPADDRHFRRVVGKTYGVWRQVRKSWKVAFDGADWGNLLGRTTSIYLCYKQAKKTGRADHEIAWFCRYGVPLRRVHIQDAHLGDVPCLKELIEKCGGEDLIDVTLLVNPGLDNKSTFATCDPARQHPVLCAEEKILHDVVARHCPNLKKLAVSLTLPTKMPYYSEYVSDALFSKETLKDLTVSLGHYTDVVDPKWNMEEVPFGGIVFSNLRKSRPKQCGFRVMEVRNEKIADPGFRWPQQREGNGNGDWQIFW